MYAGARKINLENMVFIDSAPVSEAAYKWLYCSDYKKHEPLPSIEFNLELRPGEVGYITLYDIPCWVTVNGVDLPSMSYPLNLWNMWPSASAWHNYELPATEAGRKFKIYVGYRLKTSQYVINHMQVFAVKQSGQLNNWAWKTFNENIDFKGCTEKFENTGLKSGDIVLLLPTGEYGTNGGHSFTPAFFEVHFPMPEGEQPVFINVGDMQKGQIYLNGYNIGRFWKNGGITYRYFLPREWMKEDNVLVVFEELGIKPNGTALEYDGEQPLSSNIHYIFGKYSVL